MIGRSSRTIARNSSSVSCWNDRRSRLLQPARREFVLDALELRDHSAVERLVVTDFCCRALSNDTYLVTYLLEQAHVSAAARAQRNSAPAPETKVADRAREDAGQFCD